MLYKQEERVKLLERELHIQKRSLNHSSEKLNVYRKEFSNLKASIKVKDFENDNLVEKLADYTMKVNQMKLKELPLVSRLLCILPVNFIILDLTSSLEKED